MNRLFAALVCLSVTACDKRAPPLAAYRRPIDALASALPLRVFGLYPCASLQKQDGIDVVVGVPVDQCYKMLPPQRFRGIWLDEFEGSRFFEGSRDANAVKAEVRRRLGTAEGYEWLDWSGPNGNSIPQPTTQNSRMVAIDFIGRRTAYPGRYGHMGVSRSEIVVDRIIAARLIYLSSKPYLEDEFNLR